MALYLVPEVPLPKVGDEIYLPTSLYIDRGEDDVQGGLATICRVRTEDAYVWIYTKEVPGRGYSLSYLLPLQKKLQKEFGKNRAYPDPDFG